MKRKLFIGTILLSALLAFKSENHIDRTLAPSTLDPSNSFASLPVYLPKADTVKKSASKESVVLNKLATIPQPTVSSVPILRYYNSTSHLHFYTTDPNELGNGALGYVYERTIGWLRIGTAIPPSGHNINRFVQNNSPYAHYYTINATAPSGFHFEKVIGNDNVIPFNPTLVNIMQYHSSGNDYLYTENPSQEILTNYVSDGVAFAASVSSY